MKKCRFISLVLAVCLVLTCFMAAPCSVSASTAYAPNNPYGITNSNDNATILQAWNWSYSNIESKMPKIAKQGFSVIQISPPNELKKETLGHNVTGEAKNGWWMMYQPAGFKINKSTDNALGTKAQLLKMIDTAHRYGVRVIADAVINHMGTCEDEDGMTSQYPKDHLTPRAAEFESVIVKNDLFHFPWENMTYAYEWSGPEDSCTYDLTRKCTSRLPDLKTEDTRVQNVIYNYLKELVDAGIDGFRFDAAKHIETPSDSEKYRSDFWTNTVSAVRTYAQNTYGKDVLSYGEILNTCGYGRSYDYYYPFMKVTDSDIIGKVQNGVVSGNTAEATPFGMTNGSKEQTVLWNESHDTYMTEPDKWGSTRNLSKLQRNKIWAAIAARDGITSLYLARPSSLTQQLGEASNTDWTSKEVAAVNHFNNYYSGQGEYLGSYDTIAVIGRGSSTAKGGGAVLVNCSGTGKSAAGTPVATMSDGTYTDKISGSTFTVSGGKISSGNIGATGVAVIYNAPSWVPDSSASLTGDKTILFTNNLNWSNVHLYAFDSSGNNNAAWPGVAMQNMGNNGYGSENFKGTFPKGWTIIFNGSGGQTQDIPYEGNAEGYWLDGSTTGGTYGDVYVATAWYGTGGDDDNEQDETVPPTFAPASTAAPPTAAPTTTAPVTATAPVTTTAPVTSTAPTVTTKPTETATTTAVVTAETTKPTETQTAPETEPTESTGTTSAESSTAVEPTETVSQADSSKTGETSEVTTEATETVSASDVPESTFESSAAEDSTSAEEMRTLYYTPSAENKDKNYSYKLFIKPLGEEPIEYDLEPSGLMGSNGMPIYKANVPAKYEKLEMLKYEVYDGENWISETAFKYAKLSDYNNKIIKNDGELSTEPVPETSEPYTGTDNPTGETESVTSTEPQTTSFPAETTSPIAETTAPDSATVQPSTAATEPATAETVADKLPNPVKVKAVLKTVKAKKLKAKKQTVKPVAIKGAKGTVKVVKVKSGTTAKIYKKITVNAKNGAITFKKGAYAKKTYNIKLKITVAGNKDYAAKTVVKKVRIKVK